MLEATCSASSYASPPLYSNVVVHGVSRLSVNDSSDNEVKPGAVHRSTGSGKP